MGICEQPGAASLGLNSTSVRRRGENDHAKMAVQTAGG